MYPNDNKQTNPVDYLNQISTHAPKKSFFFNKKPLLIASIVGAVIVGLVIIIAVINMISSVINPTERLAARLVNTSTVADGATAKLKNSQLKATNSNLKIYLTNTIRDFTPILASSNIKISKLSKNVTTAESVNTMLATLEDARLNAIYDRIYAIEMTHQLDITLILMNQIYNNTGKKDLKSFLENARTSLVAIQKQFADFNATNG